MQAVLGPLGWRGCAYLISSAQAAGVRHRAALPARVVGSAVEVHVLGPVLVGDSPAATELQRDSTKRAAGERKAGTSQRASASERAQAYWNG